MHLRYPPLSSIFVKAKVLTVDVSKYFILPPPPPRSKSLNWYFCSKNTNIVVLWITMPSNDVTMNVNILIHIVPCLWPVHMNRFFVRHSSGKKNRSEHLIFLSDCSGHTIYYRNVIWCTRPDFLSELSRCDNGRRGPIVTSIFYRTGVGAHKLSDGKSDFLSDQKLAHTIWFPFFFLSIVNKSNTECSSIRPTYIFSAWISS